MIIINRIPVKDVFESQLALPFVDDHVTIIIMVANIPTIYLYLTCKEKICKSYSKKIHLAYIVKDLRDTIRVIYCLICQIYRLQNDKVYII